MKISYSKGKQNKIHVSVDGEYRFTVDAEYWFLTPWYRLDEIKDGKESEKFLNEVGSRYAFVSGLRLLSYADNSRRDLFRKLTRKGHDPAYVNNALDKLEELGYVSDMRFAENTADRLLRTKHMSRSGIKSELLRKGIGAEIIQDVLERLEIDPAKEIEALIEKKYYRYLTDEKGLRKTVAALQRLGYSWSDIKSAIRKYTDGREEFDSDD